MLRNYSNLNPNEAEDLFEKSFVKEMVKSANRVKKRANLGQPGRAGGSNRLKEHIGKRAGTSKSNFYREATGSGYGDRHSFLVLAHRELMVDSAVVDPPPIRAVPATISTRSAGM